MKSESKHYTDKQLKRWLISFELWRLTHPVLYDKATKIVEAESLQKAYENLKVENMKLYITNIYEL